MRTYVCTSIYVEGKLRRKVSVDMLNILKLKHSERDQSQS